MEERERATLTDTKRLTLSGYVFSAHDTDD
jgi:hypothetical protein